MSAFAALMALSASQTKESQNAVQTALQQRQRNEDLKRKKQEEFEQKQREEDAKLRQKRFEDEKKLRELEARKEVEQAQREAEKVRREEEARASLLYGPKKARQQGPKWPSSSTGVADEVRRRRMAEEGDDSRAGSPAMALTREEKRRRRVEAELRRTYQMKRSSTSSGYSKAGRRLPGGAIDATSAPTSESGASAQSVKARLAALPNTLTKLNVNKRDTRTIDEILQDRAKAKNATLDGDEAREFNDWFGKAKRKESSGLTSTQSSATLASGPSSGANSPRVLGTKVASQSTAKSLPSTTKTPSQPSGTKASSQSKSTPYTKASSSTSKLTSDSKHSSFVVKSKSARSRSPAPQFKSQPSKSTSAARSGAAAPKKRPRSPSLSLSPPPQKRRAASPQDAIRSEIWKLFGKDRHSYVARDVVSDDEDMEADADAVMREEMRSARLARREDDQAFEEEKRHEEEKRRRKRERERQGL
ncbi:hypothetical protein BS17DRAFT_781364 [Gyrodon lividus]|nr:hypothetical protein BS17DRAFT_781364 [Gyrodon lividus]